VPRIEDRHEEAHNRPLEAAATVETERKGESAEREEKEVTTERKKQAMS